MRTRVPNYGMEETIIDVVVLTIAVTVICAAMGYYNMLCTN